VKKNRDDHARCKGCKSPTQPRLRLGTAERKTRRDLKVTTRIKQVLQKEKKQKFEKKEPELSTTHLEVNTLR
jgi:hypothetical protein